MFRLQFWLMGWLALMVGTASSAQDIDNTAWDALLAAHVQTPDGGKSTWVDYQGMMQDRQKLTEYLNHLAGVGQAEFDKLPRDDQLAFLINAYNAWTVELILTGWPNLKSIRDLGGFFSSPWKKSFVILLGETRTLDDIEHELIRGSGRYREPRIHFAVNCASIGCPALRAEAYTGARLKAQLHEQTVLFLSDPQRNRIEAGELWLSAIFDWYREDFEKGWQGFQRLEDFLIAYRDALGLSDTMVRQLRSGDMDIEHLDYDWRLNAKPGAT